MLTQVRRWGWLFNPITVFVAWDADPDAPVGAVLEVTNTPWKERHRYALALLDDRDADGWIDRSLDKELPRLAVPRRGLPLRRPVARHRTTTRSSLAIDVVPTRRRARPMLDRAAVDRECRATRATLGATLVADRFPTHRVSLGIHAQALRLWRKRVPFVPHPVEAGGASRRSTRSN